MLKIALESEEKFGGVLMTWWDGDGAARVLAQDDGVLLLERAQGNNSLVDLAVNGADTEACHIICDVAARLHAPRGKPYPDLIPLERWFEALAPAAHAHGGLLIRCAATAQELLGSPRDISILHGDLHHENVLDFGARGWLAIDPKGLIGERGFDYAILFCNPDLGDARRHVATQPGLFARRVEIVSAAAGLEPRRLLSWILAWTGLSAVWLLGDGVSPEINLRVARMAAAALDA
jgi:streptomycin 6-kinase